MPTEQDYRLEAQDGPLTKVFCSYCGSEIGEVYTASSTLTGRSTGRTEEEIGVEIDDLIREHLHQCEKQPASDPGSYVNDLPNRPPEKGSIKKQR